MEDDLTIEENLAEFLGDEGYATVTAVDGEAAQEAALLLPAAIVMDVAMPGMKLDWRTAAFRSSGSANWRRRTRRGRA